LLLQHHSLTGHVVARALDAKAVKCQFERTYACGCAPVVRELERRVLGCDYGGTSWTTRSEADRIASRLALRPGIHLLEVGAGSGWPGLYLAQRTGCEVTFADLPIEGLRAAIERAAADGLARRCAAVGADGAKLPFRDRAFDAVGHSDVLCCMPAKLAMLRECRRVAREGAKMQFSVIAVAPNLSDGERRVAIEGGPPFVEAPDDYGVLLAQSGWRLLERTDVTAPFGQALRTLVEGMTERTDALTSVFGAEDFAERMEHRRASLAATDRGLLKRELFLSVVEVG
jgi:SAM-dependent methyltransferase